MLTRRVLGRCHFTWCSQFRERLHGMCLHFARACLGCLGGGAARSSSCRWSRQTRTGITELAQIRSCSQLRWCSRFLHDANLGYTRALACELLRAPEYDGRCMSLVRYFVRLRGRTDHVRGRRIQLLRVELRPWSFLVYTTPNPHRSRQRARQTRTARLGRLFRVR